MYRLLARAAAVMTALFLALLTLLAPPAFASAPDGTDINDEVAKSVVSLTITFDAYVRYPLEGGGEDITSKPVQLTSGCTGFFVTREGHFVTAGHCVDPQEVRDKLITAARGQVVADGKLTQAAAETNELLTYALENWVVEGASKGSPPVRSVEITQPKAAGGPVAIEKVRAQVLDFRPFKDGDVALVKAEISGTQPLPIARQDPGIGTPLTSVGFPGAVGSVFDATRVRASFKSGTASSQQVSPQGVPQTEVNADLSGGMSGGPTVDNSGNVLGVNSALLRGEQAFNFITDTTDLNAFLQRNGITPVPPSSGSSLLWPIVLVGIGLVVALAAAFIIWRRRGNRLRTEPQMASVRAEVGCSHAGNPPGAPFCNNCGNRL